MSYIGRNPTVDTLNLEPQSADPSNPAEGDIFFSDGTSRATGVWQYKNGSFQPVGDGSDAPQFFENSGFEENTDGVATYDDGGAYVDGTGGIATEITAVRETSLPLVGTAMLNILKDTGDATGEGVSFASTPIDIAYRGRKLWISFEFDGDTGYAASTIAGDFKLYAYDITNARILPVIPVAGAQLDSNGVAELPGLKTKVLCFVVPDSTTEEIRFSLHMPVDNGIGVGYSVYMDELQFKVDGEVPGAIVTQELPYTPTFTGFGTVSVSNFKYSQIGNFGLIHGRFVAGTVTATEARVSLPTGWTVSNAITTLEVCGVYVQSAVGAVSQYTAAEPNQTYVVFTRTAAGEAATNKINGNGMTATGGTVSVWAMVPLKDKQASVALTTTEVGLQTAIARASGDPASATVGNPVIFPTKDYDNLNGYDTSTGLYTTKKSGKYHVHGYITSGNAAITINLCVNGTTQIAGGMTDASGECSYTGTVTVNSGDTISIEPSGTLDAATGSTLCIEEIPDFTVFSAVFDNADVELFLDTGNGHGSGSTKIRRFTNSRKNTLGPYATYADSSTLGGIVTINIPGIYYIQYCDFDTASARTFGISLNSSALTTNLSSLTYAQGKRSVVTSANANNAGHSAVTLRLSAGDIIRAHDDGATNGTTDNTIFQVIRIGN